MSPAQHKQYLIDSINEMQSFCDKLAAKMENCNNDMSYHGFRKVYASKKENISYFKHLLRLQYGYEYTAQQPLFNNNITTQLWPLQLPAITNL